MFGVLILIKTQDRSGVYRNSTSRSKLRCFSPKLLDLQAGLYGIKNDQKITETILKLVS